MARRLVLHIGGAPPGGARPVHGLADAFAAVKAGGGDLTLDLLAAPDLNSPLYTMTVAGRRVATNAAAAYLHLKLDGTVLAGPGPPAPSFSGDLQTVEQSLLDWAAAHGPKDFAERLETLSRPAGQERHRRLALLRGHLTAMRDPAVRAVEARLTAIIGSESREWL